MKRPTQLNTLRLVKILFPSKLLIYTFNKISSKSQQKLFGKWTKSEVIGQNKTWGKKLRNILYKKALKWGTISKHKIIIMKLMRFSKPETQINCILYYCPIRKTPFLFLYLLIQPTNGQSWQWNSYR